MTFNVFLPSAAANAPVPVLYFLSGLTCTEDNFIQKAGAMRTAEKHGIALVAPDTSPRGLDLPDEHKSYDFGSGAGFYVNATESAYSKNYNMYDYVTKELPALVEKSFPVTSAKSVFGHSMGGHGALICYLKNPGMYKSVSAFSPICNPINCPWGQKAFKGYLGDNVEQWKAYDATELVKSSKDTTSDILIDQGAADEFFEQKQLLPEAFQAAAKAAGIPVTYRQWEDYDHSYFFISTFIDDHIEHHAKYLKK